MRWGGPHSWASFILLWMKNGKDNGRRSETNWCTKRWTQWRRRCSGFASNSKKQCTRVRKCSETITPSMSIGRGSYSRRNTERGVGNRKHYSSAEKRNWSRNWHTSAAFNAWLGWKPNGNLFIICAHFFPLLWRCLMASSTRHPKMYPYWTRSPKEYWCRIVRKKRWRDWRMKENSALTQNGWRPLTNQQRALWGTRGNGSHHTLR